jgi:ABC-type tungstate transport system permease subunit
VDLFDDGEEAAVVNADTALEEVLDAQDLRQLTVGTLEAVERGLHEDVDLVLLHRRRQIRARQPVGHILNARRTTHDTHAHAHT